MSVSIMPEEVIRECAVCFERIKFNKGCVIIPCAHQDLCITCAKPLKNCPICRAEIHKRERLYWNRFSTKTCLVIIAVLLLQLVFYVDITIIFHVYWMPWNESKILLLGLFFGVGFVIGACIIDKQREKDGDMMRMPCASSQVSPMQLTEI